MHAEQLLAQSLQVLVRGSLKVSGRVLAQLVTQKVLKRYLGSVQERQVVLALMHVKQVSSHLEHVIVSREATYVPN